MGCTCSALRKSPIVAIVPYDWCRPAEPTSLDDWLVYLAELDAVRDALLTGENYF